MLGLARRTTPRHRRHGLTANGCLGALLSLVGVETFAIHAAAEPPQATSSSTPAPVPPPAPGIETGLDIPALRRVPPPPSEERRGARAFSERIGFYGRAAVGAGSMHLGTAGDAPTFACDIGIGGAFAPGVALVADFVAGAAAAGEVRKGLRTAGVLGIGLAWFPDPDLGLELGAFAGPSFAEFYENGSSSSGSNPGTRGWGAGIRGAYYLPISTKTSLGLMVTGWQATLDARQIALSVGFVVWN
jgi:hypothetical protein